MLASTLSPCRSVPRRAAGAVLALLGCLALRPALAQEPSSPPRPSSAASRQTSAERGARRLFQRFVEDAAVVPGGWIEGQYRYENLADGGRHFAGPLIAFKVVDDFEAGLRFGFVDVNPSSAPGDSGLSDLDLFAKYRLPGGRGRLAIGAVLKAPTGDEQKGIGTGKSDVELFGAFRADLEAVSLVANLGYRFNGDPDPPLPASEDSLLVGGAVLLPATQALTFVIEWTYESKRLASAKGDGRLTVGLQHFGEGGQGGVRGALAIPLSDGAPDYEIQLGAFFAY
jgi:hypothetical protein